mmetsp:Transcript_23201/g.65717  ORF Transcript_23201/g.65717 Transcript_23201/m.65717 type:complete len:214 (-) Transcript_23201:37-678(-)
MSSIVALSGSCCSYTLRSLSMNCWSVCVTNLGCSWKMESGLLSTLRRSSDFTRPMGRRGSTLRSVDCCVAVDGAEKMEKKACEPWNFTVAMMKRTTGNLRNAVIVLLVCCGLLPLSCFNGRCCFPCTTAACCSMVLADGHKRYLGCVCVCINVCMHLVGLLLLFVCVCRIVLLRYVLLVMSLDEVATMIVMKVSTEKGLSFSFPFLRRGAQAS